jgi:hypothetical protein
LSFPLGNAGVPLGLLGGARLLTSRLQSIKTKGDGSRVRSPHHPVRIPFAGTNQSSRRNSILGWTIVSAPLIVIYEQNRLQDSHPLSARPHDTLMKIPILLATCVILVGCERQEPQDREILNNLEALKHEFATNQSTSPRWAVVRRNDIQFAIDRWSQDRIEAAKTAETLSPEQATKLSEYESLNNQLMRIRMPRPYASPMQINPATGYPQSVADTNQEAQYEALSIRVEAARAPIASILDHRNREAEQIRHQYSPDKLVAEYVTDRFDLVIDSSWIGSMNSPILYQKNP